MGLSCVGYILGMDAERAMDEHIMGILHLLSSRQVETVVDGKAYGLPRYYRFRSGLVYISWGESFDEEFAQLLKSIMNYQLRITNYGQQTTDSGLRIYDIS